MTTLRRALFVVLVILCASIAEATTWYVGPTGHDTNNDCTEAQDPKTPKLTINNAFTQCVTLTANAGAGDTVEVATATYTETLTSWPSGTSGNPFTLNSTTQYGALLAPGGGSVNIVRFNADWIVMDGFTIDGTSVSATLVWFDTGADNVTIRDSEIRDAKDCIGSFPCEPEHVEELQGIYCTGSTGGQVLNNIIHNMGYEQNPDSRNHGIYWSCANSLIEGNTIYNVNGYAVHLFAAVGTPVNSNIVRGNLLYDFSRVGDTTNAGIILSSGSSNIASNNIIYTTDARGTAFGVSVRGTSNQVLNNTIYNVGYDGIQFSGATTPTIRNNIVWDTGGADLLLFVPGASGVCSHNLTEDTQDTDCTNVVSGGTPTFVNAGTFDLRLAAGSNGIDDGVSLAGTVDTDFAGTARPQGAAYDVGAYDFLAAPGAPTDIRLDAPPVK